MAAKSTRPSVERDKRAGALIEKNGENTKQLFRTALAKFFEDHPDDFHAVQAAVLGNDRAALQAYFLARAQNAAERDVVYINHLFDELSADVGSES